MKSYVITTGAVFGLLAVAHLWRVSAEGTGVLNPFFVCVTILAAALCGWSIVLVRRGGKTVA